MDSAVRTKDPSVWIEKTRIRKRDYEQEGPLRLGQAVYSPSRDQGGRRAYEAMRKADIGDIVLHLLQDRQQIVGVSTIKSDVEEDFEGISEFDWTKRQRQEGGYRRWLTDYVEFDNPIDIYEDVLDNATHEDALHQIQADYTGLIYDHNLSLVQGYYFTRCPDELLEIFVKEQGTTLQEYLQARYYKLEDAQTDNSSRESDVSEVTRHWQEVRTKCRKVGEFLERNSRGTLLTQEKANDYSALSDTENSSNTARSWYWILYDAFRVRVWRVTPIRVYIVLAVASAGIVMWTYATYSTREASLLSTIILILLSLWSVVR